MRFSPASCAFLCFCFFPSLWLDASAQALPRKVMFGVGTKPLDGSTAVAHHLKPGDGVLVTLVVPDSTAARLGVRVGDVITSVNQKTFANNEDLAAFARTLNAGDPVEIAFIANGLKTTHAGFAQGRPMETSDLAEVRYGAVDYALGTLRTILHIPKNKPGKLPVIFYLQGYPCASMEYLPDSKAAGKQAIDAWVGAGYAVFRVERPNLGDSRASKDCRDTDFDEELAAHVAAYKKLLSDDFVDLGNVFLFGHSLGSVTAPLLAQTFQPKGIMVYGVVLRSWFEYFVDIERVQALYYGESRVAAERAARELMPVYFEWLENGKSPAQLKQNPAFKRVFDAPGNPMNVSGDYFFGRHYRFWHTLNKKHMALAWSKVTGKVLALHGEFDVQAINATDAQNIAAVVNESHAGNGAFVLIPKAEHGFLKAESHAAVVAASRGKPDPAHNEDYNPEIGRLTVAWMNALIGHPSSN